MNRLEHWYENRFVIYIVSLVAILFGTLIFPEQIFDSLIAPIFLVLNILAGILLIYKSKKTRKIFVGILIIILLTYMVEFLFDGKGFPLIYVRFTMFFFFYALVTLEVIAQVWRSHQVDRNVILGLMSGYISLGLLGSFLFLSIELLEAGSFSGIDPQTNVAVFREKIIYFSYITMMTIGYGEITPASKLARNASVLLGLLGQFYLVIITAIVVGKFLMQESEKKK